MQRTNTPIPRCDICHKAKHATAGECKRAARRLAKNKRNDGRYFNWRRCRFCKERCFIVYSTSLENRKHKQERKVDREHQSVEQEERNTVIASIVDDERYHMTDPQSHWVWLSRTYSDKIAQDIINEAYREINREEKTK